MSNTAPAGTPASPISFIASSLVCCAGPGGDDLVDLGRALAARLPGVVARVADQILAADHLQQPLPVLGIGAAGEDIDVVVRPARLARVERRGREAAGLRPAAAAAHRRLAAQLGARERHAHVVDHRVLHRHLQAAALAGAGRARSSAPRMLIAISMPVPVSPKRRAGLDRRPVGLAGDADRAAGGLRDHVEGEALLVRAAGAEALDLAIDDAGVDLLDLVIAEAQPLDRAGRHVLDRDIGLLQQLLDDLEPARRLQVQRHRLLVGVELVEIPGVVVGLAGPQPAAGIAASSGSRS